MAIRVAVADDHPTVLAGLERLMSGFAGIKLIGLVTNSTALVELLTKSGCDVVVTDFSMPHGRYGDGISLLRFLQRRFPAIHLVVLTSIENHAVLQSLLELNIGGIVSKSDDLNHLEIAIRTARSGNHYLSPELSELLLKAAASTSVDTPEEKLSKRETEVLRLYSEGLTVSEIGARAGRSSKTISAQKVAAMRKLGLHNDADIFNYALAHGLVQASQVSRDQARQSDIKE